MLVVMTKDQIVETLAGARCFCALTSKQNLGVQAYLLGLIAGLDATVEQLVADSACYQCIPKSQQDLVLAYLISQMTGATGTPQEILASAPCLVCVPRSQYEVFKTYLLYLIVQDSVENPPSTPEEVVAESTEFFSLDQATLQSVLYYNVHAAGGGTPFDPTACAAVIADGGGDTFDCYDEGNAVTEFLNTAGTGFSALWQVVEEGGAYPYGDSFDSYSVGIKGTLTSATGFVDGKWYFLSAV